MISLLLALLPTCAAPQTGNADLPPALGPAPAEATEWQQFDGVAAVLDDRPITLRALDSQILRARGSERFADRAAQAQAIREATYELMRIELFAAAGRELDIPLDRLRTQLALDLDGQRQELGNLGFAEALREQGEDPLQQLRSREDQVLAQAWLNKVLGRSGLGNERPIVDRFLRPGELRAFYRLEAQSLGEPARIQVQILALPFDAWGGEDIVRAQLDSLLTARKADEFGPDEFNAAVEEYGAFVPEARGTTGLEPLPTLTRLEPGWTTFLESATPGSISPVLEYSQLPGRNNQLLPPGLCLLQMMRSEPGAPPPSFREREFQSRLRKALTNQRDNTRAERAVRRRLGRSYVWVTPGLEGAIDLLLGRE